MPIGGLEGEISGYVEAGGGDADREIERGFSRITYKVSLESPGPSDAIESIVEAARFVFFTSAVAISTCMGS